MADNIIGTATVQVNLDTSKVASQAAKAGKIAQSNVLKNIAAAAEGIKAVAAEASKALLAISAPAIAIGFKAVHAFLKSGSLESKQFTAKTAELTAAFARLGARIMRTPVWGKTAAQWIDVLRRKLDGLSDKGIQRLVKAFAALTAIMASVKALDIGAGLVGTIARIGASRVAASAVAEGAGTAAGRVGGTAVGSALGVGGAVGASKILARSQLTEQAPTLAGQINATSTIGGGVLASGRSALAKVITILGTLAAKIAVWAVIITAIVSVFVKVIRHTDALKPVISKLGKIFSHLGEGFSRMADYAAIAVASLFKWQSIGKTKKEYFANNIHGQTPAEAAREMAYGYSEALKKWSKAAIADFSKTLAGPSATESRERIKKYERVQTGLEVQRMYLQDALGKDKLNVGLQKEIEDIDKQIEALITSRLEESNNILAKYDRKISVGRQKADMARGVAESARAYAERRADVTASYQSMIANKPMIEGRFGYQAYSGGNDVLAAITQRQSDKLNEQVELAKQTADWQQQVKDQNDQMIKLEEERKRQLDEEFVARKRFEADLLRETIASKSILEAIEMYYSGQLDTGL